MIGLIFCSALINMRCDTGVPGKSSDSRDYGCSSNSSCGMNTYIPGNDTWLSRIVICNFSV